MNGGEYTIEGTICPIRPHEQGALPECRRDCALWVPDDDFEALQQGEQRPSKTEGKCSFRLMGDRS